jgi:hypothetical protein
MKEMADEENVRKLRKVFNRRRTSSRTQTCWQRTGGDYY